MHDLPGYLAHTGFEGTARADLPTLRQLVLRHVLTIPFENLDALTGRRPSLDPADVERKLLRQRRGGWCFEQNLLLGNALRALGFAVEDLAAREVIVVVFTCNTCPYAVDYEARINELAKKSSA